MGRLDNKVIIVTGAAGGMGEAYARKFVEEGAKVILADINEEKGNAIADELGENATFVKLDVRNKDQWENAVRTAEEKYGYVTGLMNNAAIDGNPEKLIEEVTREEYDEMFDINVYGVFLGMQAVVESMKKNKSGSIVNVSSTAGVNSSKWDAAIYVGSKFAVTGLSKAAAVEFGKYNIRVNSLHPGAIATPMLAEVGPEVIETINAETALNRTGKTEEIANIGVFLMSDESTYSTGAEFMVDGGLLLK